MMRKLYITGYIITILSTIGIVITLLVGWNMSDKEEPINPVNSIRVKVNPMYTLIQNNWPLSTEIKQQLNESLEENEVTCAITNLEGKVIYQYESTFTIDSTIDLKEHLYVDNSYIERNNNQTLISFPIYSGESVVGFVIFGSHIVVNDGNHMPQEWILTLITLSIVWIVSIISTIVAYYKQPSNYYEDIVDGLNKVTKGILNPIKLPKESEKQGMYISYNRMVEELSYVMKKQETYEGERRNFLTTISHELKTPIATINAYVEGLVSGVAKDEKTIKNYQSIIQDKMKSLMQQVDDLFKYAQNEMNEFKYNLEEAYADEVFSRIVQPIINREDNREVIIKDKVPKCIINVDVIRIEQVILNLYNNAIKHTPKNGSLIIEGYRQEDELLISLSDNGEGIDPRDLPYIFDYYYQGKTSKKLDYEGVGLGLAICKKIIDKHGGKIYVKSQLGKGTKISFTIPVV